MWKTRGKCGCSIKREKVFWWKSLCVWVCMCVIWNPTYSCLLMYWNPTYRQSMSLGVMPCKKCWHDAPKRMNHKKLDPRSVYLLPSKGKAYLIDGPTKKLPKPKCSKKLDGFIIKILKMIENQFLFKWITFYFCASDFFFQLCFVY